MGMAEKQMMGVFTMNGTYQVHSFLKGLRMHDKDAIGAMYIFIWRRLSGDDKNTPYIELAKECMSPFYWLKPVLYESGILASIFLLMTMPQTIITGYLIGILSIFGCMMAVETKKCINRHNIYIGGDIYFKVLTDEQFKELVQNHQ